MYAIIVFITMTPLIKVTIHLNLFFHYHLFLLTLILGTIEYFNKKLKCNINQIYI